MIPHSRPTISSGLTANRSKKDKEFHHYGNKNRCYNFRAVIITYFTVRCKFEEKKGTYEKWKQNSQLTSLQPSTLVNKLCNSLHVAAEKCWRCRYSFKVINTLSKLLGSTSMLEHESSLILLGNCDELCCELSSPISSTIPITQVHL